MAIKIQHLYKHITFWVDFFRNPKPHIHVTYHALRLIYYLLQTNKIYWCTYEEISAKWIEFNKMLVSPLHNPKSEDLTRWPPMCFPVGQRSDKPREVAVPPFTREHLINCTEVMHPLSTSIEVTFKPSLSPYSLAA